MASAEENVRIVSQLYAAFGSGNIPGVLALVDANASWVNIYGAGRFPGQWGRPCHSHAEIGAFFQAINDTVEVQGFEVRDLIAQGDRVAVCPWRGVTKKTGKPFSVQLVHVWTLKNGKIIDYVGLDDATAYPF